MKIAGSMKVSSRVSWQSSHKGSSRFKIQGSKQRQRRRLEESVGLQDPIIRSKIKLQRHERPYALHVPGPGSNFARNAPMYVVELRRVVSPCLPRRCAVTAHRRENWVTRDKTRERAGESSSMSRALHRCIRQGWRALEEPWHASRIFAHCLKQGALDSLRHRIRISCSADSSVDVFELQILALDSKSLQSFDVYLYHGFFKRLFNNSSSSLFLFLTLIINVIFNNYYN